MTITGSGRGLERAFQLFLAVPRVLGDCTGMNGQVGDAICVWQVAKTSGQGRKGDD